MQPCKPRTIFYIDGYNWYHAIFKHYPEWKWLNIQSFVEALRPHDDVVSVKVFSAMHSAVDAKDRQEKYFRALKTLSKIKLILGTFQPREVTCRANGCKYSYQEEKKTDVNIAVELLSDAIDDKFDSACLISGDSDIQPAVEWVSRRKSDVKITVYIPALPAEQHCRRIDYYSTKKLPVSCKFLPLDGLASHQLPAIVKINDGSRVIRPHVWQKQCLTGHN